MIVFFNIVGTLFSCSLAAYAFARLRFRGSDLLFNILIITMLVPWQALIIPQFLLFFKLGWYGTYLPLIVPSFTGGAFYIFLIRQYMRTFPKDLDDAARIDGAGYFRILLGHHPAAEPAGADGRRRLRLPRRLERSAGTADLPQRDRAVHPGHRPGQLRPHRPAPSGTC